VEAAYDAFVPAAQDPAGTIFGQFST